MNLFKKTQIKLTLINSLLFALLFCFLSGAFYLFTSKQLHKNIDDSLHIALNSINSELVKKTNTKSLKRTSVYDDEDDDEDEDDDDEEHDSDSPIIDYNENQPLQISLDRRVDMIVWKTTGKIVQENVQDITNTDGISALFPKYLQKTSTAIYDDENYRYLAKSIKTTSGTYIFSSTEKYRE